MKNLTLDQIRNISEAAAIPWLCAKGKLDQGVSICILTNTGSIKSRGVVLGFNPEKCSPEIRDQISKHIEAIRTLARTA